MDKRVERGGQNRRLTMAFLREATMFMHKIWLAISAIVALLSCDLAYAQSSAEGALWENRHITRHVKAYEGTKTCLQCHDEEAADVFKSIHYQWAAPAPNITNAKGKRVGKLNSTNDFCTNPSVSWISILTNDEGKVIGEVG